jgi:hypothetical protein
VTKGRTQHVIDLSGSTEFTDEDGGTTRAYFPLLDIQGRGATREEAFRALIEQIDAITANDENARAAFSEWAQDNIIEKEMTADEIRAEDEIDSKAEEASSHFRALTSDSFGRSGASRV